MPDLMGSGGTRILFDLTRTSVGVCLLSGFEGLVPLSPLLFENWILQNMFFLSMLRNEENFAVVFGTRCC